MIVCFFDFVLFPILWSAVQAIGHGQVNVQWQPITLQGAGLFHIAMGAVLGIAAYGRTQEKLGGANNGGLQLPANVGTTYTPPPPMGQPVPNNFGTPMATTVTQTFGSPPPMASGFGSGSTFGTTGTAPVTTGWGGKKAPPPQIDPEI